MFDLPAPLGTIANFLVIAIGFGSIIFVHELGHFVAAKWAGIRVLAFSIGFGQVACSFRKGMGFQMGSSEPKYNQLVRDAQGEDGPERDHARTQLSGIVSPTEYRLSWLPLGGYVKMLGQEDLNPDAVSTAPDSYQNCSIPKRLVVLSAGVAVNVVTAALLFMLVFSVGLKIMPPTVGQVLPGSPAALATPIDTQYPIGLQPGDTILSVNDIPVRAFRAIATEAAMSSASRPADILVQREGIEQPIHYAANLKPSAQLGLLDLGIAPLPSTTLVETDDAELWDLTADNYGLHQIPPGSTINSVNGRPVETALQIQSIAMSASAMSIEYADPDGAVHSIVVNSQQQLMNQSITIDGSTLSIDHILGLTGLIRVHPDVPASETKQGLMPGDVFIKIASTEYPSLDAGIRAIRDHSGQPIDLSVLRADPETGAWRVVDLEVQVSDDGRIGFYPDTTTYTSTMLTITPSVEHPVTMDLPSGAMINTINDHPVTSLDAFVPAIIAYADSEPDQSEWAIPMTYTLPKLKGDHNAPGSITITREQLAQLRALPNRWPGGADMAVLFQPVQTIDKATSPIDAVGRGLQESRRTMLQTYLTFLRLTQGSVKVEHLKGPVGIAHIGTLIADEGFIKVLFFMGLISINLAVINFLPLPIVDGGQCLFLIYEWIRGKPIPIPVQNAVTMAGLLLIGSMFLLVTFNDLKSLVGF